MVNAIRKAGKITLEEINRRWIETETSEGMPLARSTFNRHRDAILDIFGIIIECDKKDGFRYYIDNSDVLEEDSIQNRMLSTMSVNSILAENKGVHDRIVLESIPSDGENLHKFIDAMKRGVMGRIDTYCCFTYLDWLHTQEWTSRHKDARVDSWLMDVPELYARRAPGNTCLSALHVLEDGREAMNDSCGCGGVMRTAPLTLLNQLHGYADGDKLYCDMCAA